VHLYSTVEYCTVQYSTVLFKGRGLTSVDGNCGEYCDSEQQSPHEERARQGKGLPAGSRAGRGDLTVRHGHALVPEATPAQKENGQQKRAEKGAGRGGFRLRGRAKSEPPLVWNPVAAKASLARTQLVSPWFFRDFLGETEVGKGGLHGRWLWAG